MSFKTCKRSKLVARGKQLALAALMLSVALSGSTIAALADDAGKSNAQAQADTSFVPNSLTQVPALPDFPAYGGRSTFVHGLVYANAPGGVSYTYLIGVPEPVQTVKSWYQLALKGNQWNFTPAGGNPDVIAAKKNGNFCQVEVKAPTRQGDGAQIMVIYHAVRPVSTD